jgi:hypothetical protein
VSESYFRWQDDTLVLFCHLQPKASADEFAGLHGKRLKIRIKAAPVDGKANKQLIKFLAKQFGVSKQRISISSGEGNRLKTLHISQPATFPAALRQDLATGPE